MVYFFDILNFLIVRTFLHDEQPWAEQAAVRKQKKII